MLIVRPIKLISAVGGAYPEGIVVRSDESGGELWTFMDRREVIEAKSIRDYRVVPLDMYHVEALLAGGAIDWRTARMLHALLV